MKMIYYEMKKSWLRIPVLILLIGFCFLSIYKICGMYSITGKFGRESEVKMKEAYFSLYDTLSGEITEDKIQYINKMFSRLDREVNSDNFSTEYNEDSLTGYIFGDYSLVGFTIIPELEYAVTYPNLSNRICNDAYENIFFFNERQNYAESKRNALIYKSYRGREIKSYDLTEWTEFYFKYDFSSLLVIIMMIVGLSPSFSMEKESGMESLINASGAEYKTVSAKIISAGVYILLLTLVFAFSDLAAVKVFCGADGFSNPLYSAKMFKLTPYDFSLIKAMIICTAIKFLAFTIIGEIMMIISAVMKKTVFALCTGFAVIVVLMLCADKNSLMVNPINMLSPYKLLEKFDCRFVCGEPILSVYYYAIVYIVMITLLFLGLIFTVRRERGVPARNKKAVC